MKYSLSIFVGLCFSLVFFLCGCSKSPTAAYSNIREGNYYMSFDPSDYYDVADIDFSYDSDWEGDGINNADGWVCITVRFFDDFECLSNAEQQKIISSFEEKFIEDFFDKYCDSEMSEDFDTVNKDLTVYMEYETNYGYVDSGEFIAEHD